MAKASDNPFPSVLLVEQAAAPATPAAGQARLYRGTDNKLYIVDDAGAATEVGAGGGSTGEATWTAPSSFLGTWVNFGAPYANVGYRKDGSGVVHLRGLVKSGSTGTNIFVLPVGYRPAADLLQNNNTIIVRANGEVSHNGGSLTAFSLEGVTFYAA